MATALSSLITIARASLIEPTANFWTDAELVSILNLGIADLWRGINELRQKHFCTLDTTNVYLAASGTTLTGVPADLFRVHMLEPRDLSSSGSSRMLHFEPKSYEHPEFQAARASDSLDPSSGGTIYWEQGSAGGPVAAPVVYIAPTVTSQVLLKLMYVPTLGTYVAGDNNPIPGHADQALVNWLVAYARAKEREDRSPDPGWIELYATEKRNLIRGLDERQVQDQETADAMFQPYW